MSPYESPPSSLARDHCCQRMVLRPRKSSLLVGLLAAPVPWNLGKALQLDERDDEL